MKYNKLNTNLQINVFLLSSLPIRDSGIVLFEEAFPSEV